MEDSDDEIKEISSMEASVMSVENLLSYRFVEKKLLEEALTHSSSSSRDFPSYERLEFLGDSALGLAFSRYAYLNYPCLDPGKLTLIRSANLRTEKLARVAVRRRLYKFIILHNASPIHHKVKEFVAAVQEETEVEMYGGLVKAPKILADIVESLAAAVYVDCNFDLNTVWRIFRDVLDPIVTLDDLEKQPQPVTMLYNSCKKVRIDYQREGGKFVATVSVDGKFVSSASSEQKDTAKLHAAKAALQKMQLISQLNKDKDAGSEIQRRPKKRRKLIKPVP